MTPKQKSDFGALGDTQKWKICKIWNNHSYNPHTPLNPHTTQVHLPAIPASPNKHDRLHNQCVPSGEMENSKNKTTTVATPAHHSSPRTPPTPHLQLCTTGSMTSESPAAFAAHVCYQILFYHTTAYLLVVEICILKLVHFLQLFGEKIHFQAWAPPQWGRGMRPPNQKVGGTSCLISPQSWRFHSNRDYPGSEATSLFQCMPFLQAPHGLLISPLMIILSEK